MPRIPLATLPIALAFTLLLALPARADDAAAVAGTGRVAIKRLPQVLRVQLVVSGQAKDAAGAVAKLKDAKVAAAKKLAELGAAEKSIEFGSIRLGGPPPDSRNQYAQYMAEMQRAMREGAAPAPPGKPGFIVVSATCKAEWPLTAGSEEELLVAGLALQEKIKSAGVGKPDGKKLSPEDAEAAEEAMMKAGGGEPAFQYVCKVSAADLAAARAEAFVKAKLEATAMAKAAGGELGALRHLSGMATSPTALEGAEQAMPAFLQQMVASTATAVAEVASDEAIAGAPVTVMLQVTVTASFSLK
jgi:uncharacterized protein YggE